MPRQYSAVRRVRLCVDVTGDPAAKPLVLLHALGLPRKYSPSQPQTIRTTALTWVRTVLDELRHHVVGRTHHDANRDLFVVGDLLPVRLGKSRAKNAP